MSAEAARAQDRTRETGFLAFVVVDLASFLLFLIALSIEGASQRDVFRASSLHLDRGLGVLNTSILLTSGWLVALAVPAIRAGRRRLGAALLTGGAVVGSAFGVVKAVEYGDKLRHGLTPQTDEFFAFYYVVTGIHLVHWAAGLVFLAALSTLAWRRVARPAPLRWLETGALYWHMVDMIWVLIFPVLYFQWLA